MQLQTSYDRAAQAYADHLWHELTGKPLDRHLLNRLAESLRGKGLVADFGCGPGHVSAYLQAQGLETLGLDLSPEMIRTAQSRLPELRFEVGDMRALPLPGESLAGGVAMYSIVHFAPEGLEAVFRELHRVLQTDGLLLIAFHIGEQLRHVDEMFGVPVDLDFQFHLPTQVMDALRLAGFMLLEATEREPYPGAEYPSRRAYLLAKRG